MGSGLYWRITRDTANVGEYNRKGTSGPGNPPADTTLPTPIRFRLHTEDFPHEDRGAYYGVAANDDSAEMALEFGRADYGMTDSDIWIAKGEACFWREHCHAKRPGVGHWEPYMG